MAPAVHRFVIVDNHFTVRSWRNDRDGATLVEVHAEPVGIERLVAKQGIEADACDERSDAYDIVALPWQENKTDQVTQSIDQGDDLRRQTTARAADGVLLGSAFCAAGLLMRPGNRAINYGIFEIRFAILYHVWTARGVQVGLQDIGLGSNAVMCPASHEGVLVKLLHR
jgi:hypothetical protein